MVGAGILDPPSNLTVFIDQSAVFTCETDGGLPGWRVNGTLLQDLPPDIRSDLVVLETNTDEGSTLEQITIPARAEYNTTKIQCLALAVAFSGSEESENATIIIQGVTSLQKRKAVITTHIIFSQVYCQH